MCDSTEGKQGVNKGKEEIGPKSTQLHIISFQTHHNPENKFYYSYFTDEEAKEVK